jgi:hypothetical protein
VVLWWDRTGGSNQFILEIFITGERIARERKS